jgi:hypothetical protein
MTCGVPPPQGIDSPLIETDKGEARKAITAATWLASMSVRVRLRPAIRRSISAGSTPAAAACATRTPGVASVRVSPGWTAFTLMPDGPSSSARFLVIADTATLRMDPMIDPVLRAASPLTLMIRPQPASTMPGATAWAHRR